MARFYVGQRVRIARVFDGVGDEFLGHEGRIVSPSFNFPGCWFVSDAIHHNGAIISWTEGELEPITDPGREVIAWSECVWKPEHLRTEA